MRSWRGSVEVTVDLERRELRAGDLVAEFALDDFTRWRLMEGLDDIGLTLRHADDIRAFEERHLRAQPWLANTI